MMRELFLKYVPVLLYMTVIFYLSSIPLDVPDWINIFDPKKFSLHTIEYSILGYLLFRASGRRNISFVVGSFYGLTDEIHQYFTGFRIADPFDLAADMFGSFIGAFVAYKYASKKSTHERA